MSTASQLMTKRTCCSADRRIPPAKFAVECSLYARDYPVAEIIDRDNATGEGDKVFDEMVNNCISGSPTVAETPPARPNVIARAASYVPIPPGVRGTAFTRFPITTARTIIAKGICCSNMQTTA